MIQNEFSNRMLLKQEELKEERRTRMIVCGQSEKSMICAFYVWPFLFCYETVLGSIEHFYNRSRILKSCLYFSAKRCGSVYSGVCAHHVWQNILCGYCLGTV